MQVKTTYIRDPDDPDSIGSRRLDEFTGFIASWRSPKDEPLDSRGKPTPCEGMKAFNRIKDGMWFEGDVERFVDYLDVLAERAERQSAAMKTEKVAENRDGFSLKAYDGLTQGLDAAIARIADLKKDFLEGLKEAMEAMEATVTSSPA